MLLILGCASTAKFPDEKPTWWKIPDDGYYCGFGVSDSKSKDDAAESAFLKALDEMMTKIKDDFSLTNAETGKLVFSKKDDLEREKKVYQSDNGKKQRVFIKVKIRKELLEQQ